MKKGYENKMMTSGEQRSELIETNKKSWFFPQQQIEVQAETYEEAVEKMKDIISKNMSK